MKNSVLIEICVDSAESALAAERGGAHRVELCSDLVEGGITPSAGLIATVREKVGISLQVIIRPRGGDFCYTEAEFECMRRDVLTAKQLGADGIVFGVLNEHGHVDKQRTRALVALARPLSTTFHRAFDMSAELNQALEDVVDTGVNRVLTSGGRQNAEDGIETIVNLVEAAKDRISVMVGGGIRETNVRRILIETGAQEIHANVGHSVPSPMNYHNNKISLGTVKGREYQRVVVLQDRVRRLINAASAASPALATESTMPS